MADMATKKRHPASAGKWNGAANPNCKLDPIHHTKIREIYQKGGVSQATLSGQYGISQEQISRIVRGVSGLEDE